MIRPLQKRTDDGKGELYSRRSEVEAEITALASLPRDELIKRCAVRSRRDPSYVRSETILYFLRSTRGDNSSALFDRLFHILSARITAALPRVDSLDGKTSSATNSEIRDAVYGRFEELLACDRQGYEEGLDFFEVMFDAAISKLKIAAERKAWRDENRYVSIEFDPETNEPSRKVEEAYLEFKHKVDISFDDPDFRSRLNAAIDTLPKEQIGVIHMLLQDFQMHSKDPEVMTIAKALDCDEKTVRNRRDRAVKTLRAMLFPGDDR
ncbi:DNA-binding response regulator [Sphingomonas sp.]|uniref:DNA-binding response regulator n=1 Tax=Sphingomonas sp. TaxID=28214 RepID=UPI002DF2241D|nr:DNA-binding response regulator [Sphingomonas sp.]